MMSKYRGFHIWEKYGAWYVKEADSPIATDQFDSASAAIQYIDEFLDDSAAHYPCRYCMDVNNGCAINCTVYKEWEKAYEILE